MNTSADPDNRKHTDTKSNIAWHRPQSTTDRVEDELMLKSSKAVAGATDTIEKVRLLCLSRGACGILELGKTLRALDHEGRKQLNREQFYNGLKESGLDLNSEEVDELFNGFDNDGWGYISIGEFIREVRPPMSESRKSIVEQAFKKLDENNEGVVSIEELRKMFSVKTNPRYMSGEESGDATMSEFLKNFESVGAVDGMVRKHGHMEADNVTLEEFMNYYSGISVSIDNDCYFDLMIRKSFKL